MFRADSIDGHVPKTLTNLYKRYWPTRCSGACSTWPYVLSVFLCCCSRLIDKTNNTILLFIVNFFKNTDSSNNLKRKRAWHLLSPTKRRMFRRHQYGSKKSRHKMEINDSTCSRIAIMFSLTTPVITDNNAQLVWMINKTKTIFIHLYHQYSRSQP